MPLSNPKESRYKGIYVNTIALRAEARNRTKPEMLTWLRNETGRYITASDFEKILRDCLPEEGYYQTEIMDFIRENYPGAFVWKAAAGPYSRRGIPDICAVIDGHFFGFEVKRPFIGQLSKIQERTIAEIKEAGGTVAVISFWNHAKEVIENEKNKGRKETRIG